MQTTQLLYGSGFDAEGQLKPAEDDDDFDREAASPAQVPFPKLNIGWCGCDEAGGVMSPRSMASPRSSSVRSPLSPTKRRSRPRASMMKRAVRVVSSPFPYMVLILLAVMIVMIFVDVMPISGLICVCAITMVVSVVVGNHWRNQRVWDEVSQEEEEQALVVVPLQQPDGHQRGASSSSGGHTSKSDPTAAPHRRQQSREVYYHVPRSDHTPEIRHDGPTLHQRQYSKASHSSSSEQQQQVINPAVTSAPGQPQQQPLEICTDLSGGDQSGAVRGDADSLQQQQEGLSREDKLDNLNLFFEELFASIDYSLLLIFTGTFIVVENMASTGIPKFIW